MTENIIDIKSLKKIYKVGKEEIHAVDGIDLSIKKGEVLSICGTSGSGKSTLLNLIAGLEKPTSGDIIFNNKNISKMSEKQKTVFRRDHIGFIFQSYNLIHTQTALENVSMPLMFKKIRKKERMKMSKQVLQKVELGDRYQHKPNQMSGGQQQRVGIARALVSNPEIVFADEPTGNLDSKTSDEVMSLMVKSIKENNQTLIVVTHDETIAKYADRTLHIKDGKIDKIVHKLTEDRQ
ncbi:MAG: ABC transporter ATP-binding protein [Clostridia bacterium]|nr:ABC transporter ATP-binding protein [Clostridia bacterium]